MIYLLLNAIDTALWHHHHRKLAELGGYGLHKAKAGHFLCLVLDPNGELSFYDLPAADAVPPPSEAANRHATLLDRAWRRQAYRIGRRWKLYNRITAATKRAMGLRDYQGDTSGRV